MERLLSGRVFIRDQILNDSFGLQVSVGGNLGVHFVNSELINEL
jgi:hypothetical protein